MSGNAVMVLLVGLLVTVVSFMGWQADGNLYALVPLALGILLTILSFLQKKLKGKFHFILAILFLLMCIAYGIGFWMNWEYFSFVMMLSCAFLALFQYLRAIRYYPPIE